ncbi:hypothetical protein RJT34_00618 [Clitoria ternatea]|uniref:Uncharacterized protein n=1 Tax=Clitoria ternatea TaxID=43366 RepID=A0AAN9KFZ8_CLITE
MRYCLGKGDGNAIASNPIHEALPVNRRTMAFPNKNTTTFPLPSRHTPLLANPIPFRQRVNAVTLRQMPLSHWFNH